MTETNACQANLVRISAGVNATALLDLLATLKIALTYRRPRHCLQGQSIFVIVIMRTDLISIVVVLLM